MSNLIVAAAFTKSSGEPATGLTLSDISLYLTRVDSSGTATEVWDGTQNPTAEVDNVGMYVRVYTSADLDTYTYYSCAQYTGATSLDVDYVIGAAGRADAILTTAGEAALADVDVTVVSAVSGDTITVVPYTTWEFEIDGLADLSDALTNGVVFTVKADHDDADASAILQVQEGVGLLYINGAAGTAAKATLTVAGSEDAITVHVNASQTGIAERRHLVWDIKKLLEASEDADQMATGTFHISSEAVTRRLTTT